MHNCRLRNKPPTNKATISKPEYAKNYRVRNQPPNNSTLILKPEYEYEQPPYESHRPTTRQQSGILKIDGITAHATRRPTTRQRSGNQKKSHGQRPRNKPPKHQDNNLETQSLIHPKSAPTHPTENLIGSLLASEILRARHSTCGACGRGASPSDTAPGHVHGAR